jgi:hypothetical protein
VLEALGSNYELDERGMKDRRRRFLHALDFLAIVSSYSRTNTPRSNLRKKLDCNAGEFAQNARAGKRREAWIVLVRSEQNRAGSARARKDRVSDSSMSSCHCNASIVAIGFVDSQRNRSMQWRDIWNGPFVAFGESMTSATIPGTKRLCDERDPVRTKSHYRRTIVKKPTKLENRFFYFCR